MFSDVEWKRKGCIVNRGGLAERFGSGESERERKERRRKWKNDFRVENPKYIACWVFHKKFRN